MERIIVLSDIHADLHAFIISMRDCAQVIKKKDGFVFNQNIDDNDLERLLRINLNDIPNEYIQDLNYEWIADNTTVVIVGDMIDGYRPGYTSINWAKNYLQLEIKLLLFINKLNQLATAKNSRVIKVLGNHEFMNMAEVKREEEHRSKFIFPEDFEKGNNYYKGQSRLCCFRPEFTKGIPGEGFKLLMEGGAYVFYEINNNFFVHGSLEKGRDKKYYEDMNKELKINPTAVIIQNTFNPAIDPNQTSMAWDRRYGKTKNINRRLEEKNTSYCNDIKEDLKTLTGDEEVYKYRVFVGHCIQSESTIEDQKNTTFTKIAQDPTKPFIEMIEPPARSGIADPNSNFLFGMTMECHKTDELNDHYLYHVDIGSSRGFDVDDIIITGKYLEKRHLYSRTPQVIEIYNNNKNVRIIRSTMKNTRIHQPRIEYEAWTSTVPELRLSTYQKYLKYKRKYLKLKNLI